MFVLQKIIKKIFEPEKNAESKYCFKKLTVSNVFKIKL